MSKREKRRETQDDQSRAGETNQTKQKEGSKSCRIRALSLLWILIFRLQTVKTTRSGADFEECSPLIATAPETASDLIVSLVSNQWFLWLVTHWWYNQINMFMPGVSPNALKKVKIRRKSQHWVPRIPCIPIETVVWLASSQGLKGLFDNRRAHKRNPSHV